MAELNVSKEDIELREKKTIEMLTKFFTESMTL